VRYGEISLGRMNGDRQIENLLSGQLMGRVLPSLGSNMVWTGSQTMTWNQDHPVNRVSGTVMSKRTLVTASGLVLGADALTAS